MNEKYLKLLLLLSEQQEWRVSKELSQLLGFSQRTIKNYIQQINEELPEAILSSKKGYKLNALKRADIFAYFRIDTNNKLETIEHRRKYLLLDLLKANEPLNIFDLSEALFASVTTLKNDVQQLNNDMKEYEIKIVFSGDYLEVIGEEAGQRRAFIDQVYEDTDLTLLTVEMIQQLFPELPVLVIKEMISDLLAKQQLFVDDYVLTSILLHIVLFIEQAKEGTKTIPSKQIEILDQDLYELSKQLMAQLQAELQIQFEANKIYEIYLLFLAKTASFAYKKVTRENIQSFVSKETFDIVESIIEFLNHFYVVDLNDDSFYIPFILHTNSLIIRARAGHLLKNPLLASVKDGHPFIYELAVSVTNIISEQIDCRISADEIGYVALHLGGAFSKENQKYHKLVCALLVPDVRSLAHNLKKKIETQFSDNIFIESVYATHSDAKELANFDLVISTIPLLAVDSSLPVVQISPFFSIEDQKKIYFSIDDIKLRKTYAAFKENLSIVTDEKYFMRNTVLKNRDEVIEVVADILENEGIVEKDFKGNMIAREEMSSTAFHNCAIPHTFKMTALKSKLYMIISEKPIQWGKNHGVNFVFLFAINEKDKQLFYNIFEILSLIFSDKNHVLQAIKLKKFDDFIAFLLSQEHNIME
ncbi:BglG family transcription antiterminator [Isobaculum melis]|uniref:Transcriptional antiterminator, BglG family n=1 Tax=Isobaculum melis TaxID=142588 RepID=A0A1H9Q6T3_9LACT|nr:PTS sugar transporter subunit IIA [Isobaculum melis]SER55553.1 transcriptional antiterminator, BglG family [Isobaculum melis]